MRGEHLLEQMRAALRDRLRLPRGARVLVALSGGPDSLALLHGLARLAPDERLELVAGHVDHGLRPASSQEAEQVRELGRALGVRVVVRRVALGGAVGNVQERARLARRQRLVEVAVEEGAEWIALGHTATDQAETVLQRMLRGAGSRGLRGMAWRAGCFLRPLLGTTRETIESYVAAHALVPLRDGSNDSDAYLRNRLRRHVLPQLVAENPRAVQALCRLAATAREEDATLERQARRLHDRIRVAEGGISVVELTGLGPGLLHRVLRRAVAEARGSARGLSRRHLESLASLIASSDGSAEVHLPGLQAIRTYHEVRFQRSGARRPSGVARAVPTVVIGEEPACVAWSGRTVELAWEAAPCGARSGEWVRPTAEAERFVLRGPLPGDRLRIAHDRHKRVSRLLMEARVPARERAEVPVVAVGTAVWLVAGVRTAHDRLPAPGELALRVRLR